MLKKDYKAEHVLNSSDDDFDAKLQELVNKTGANVCLEAVAGEMTGRIL